MRHSYFLFLLILFLTCQKSEAQYNYVPNPSFEEYDTLTFYAPDSTIHNYYYFSDWFVPVSCGYSNYFNSNLNYVDTAGGMGISQYGVPQNPWSYTYPYDGNAQSAFCAFTLSLNEGLRNYLEIKLRTSLIQDHKYCVSFFITIADTCYIAIDQIGAIFTNDTLQHFNPYGDPPCYLLQSPQVVSPPGEFLNIRNQWQNIAGTFIAHGGEQFLTIGNFKTDPNTNYIWLPDVSTYAPNACYLIDMVSVIECDSIVKSAYAGKDTIICLGDSVRLGSSGSSTGYQYRWVPGTGLSDSCINNPMASPLQTTTYILYQTYFGSDTTSDTVTVIMKDCNNGVNESIYPENLQIRIYPNPANYILHINGCKNKTYAEVLDLSGKILISQQIITDQLDISTLVKGMYFIKLSAEEGSMVRKFVNE